MHRTNLRRVGGSVMLAVPPSLLELLELKPGEPVGLKIEAGRLIVEPRPGPKYTLDELLAASDYGAARGAEEDEWLAAAPAGREIL